MSLPSFIESSFCSRVEYEAALKLPPSQSQGWSHATWRMHSDPYNLLNLDDRRSPSPYMRFAVHLGYEPTFQPLKSAPYARKATTIVEAGLCRALGSAASRLCVNESYRASDARASSPDGTAASVRGRGLIDDLSFRYCEFSWGEPRHRESRLGSYLENLWRSERESRTAAAAA